MRVYDRESGSLWSRIAAKAIAGRGSGQPLSLVRSRHTRLGRWRRAHPETSVLSPDTAYACDYIRSPYGDDARTSCLSFPASVDNRYPPKTPTVGIRLRGMRGLTRRVKFCASVARRRKALLESRSRSGTIKRAPNLVSSRRTKRRSSRDIGLPGWHFTLGPVCSSPSLLPANDFSRRT